MKTIKTLFTILLLLVGSSMLAQSNLAIDGTVTVSSEEHAGTLAEYANDDNITTRWSTAHLNDDQWLVLKLAQAYDINDVSIKWQNANAEAYALDVSTDSINWTRIDSISGKSSGDRTDEIIVNTSAQYIRVVCYNRSTVWGYSIYEIEVYPTVSEAQDASLSDIKVDNISLSDFDTKTKAYTYFVEEDETTIPTVIATPTIAGANVNITQASTIPGTATINITATDGSTTDAYTIDIKEAVTLPVNFESSTLEYIWNQFGAPTTVIDNPQVSGINTSAKVAQIIKNSGATWNGSYITLDAPFSIMSEKRVTAKFFSPRVGSKIAMKIETASGYATAEIIASTKVANGWETLTFDFTGFDASKEYVKVVIMCDRDSLGDGSADYTYLVDDIKLYEADLTKDATLSDLKVDGTTIINFDSENTDYNYTLSSAIVPSTTATTTITGATVLITDATSIPGTTTVQVTSTDGTVNKTYSIYYAESPVSEYCDRLVSNFNHDSDGSQSSAINLTISNIDATSFYVEISSAAPTDTVDFLLVNGVTGFTNTQEISEEGAYKKTFTATGEVPDSVSLEILWSKLSEGGNWMLNTFKVPFTAECIDPGQPTITKSIAESNNLKLYPNPVADQLYITSDIAVKNVRIYAINGQLVKTVPINGGSVDVSALTKGYYITKVNFSDGTQGVSRIVKL